MASATRYSATTVYGGTTAICAVRHSVVSVKALSIVESAASRAALIAKMCSNVKSARRDSATTAKSTSTAKCARRNSAVSAKTLSTVKSATSAFVATAKICSHVKSVMSHSALIVELPSPAANQTFVLVAKSRSLAAMNASISFVASGAKRDMRDMLAVVQKAKRLLPKGRKYLVLYWGDSSQRGEHAFDLQVVASANTDRAHPVRSPSHSKKNDST